jgi:hypothetical protein
MNLVSFIKEEPTGGLAVSDTALRFVLFTKDAKAPGKTRTTVAEELLPDGIIIGGVIKNPSVLSERLKALKEKIASTAYVILSIPADAVYLETLSYPSSVNQEQLEEALRLTADFNFPWKPEDMAFDWERKTGSSVEAMAVGAPKTVANAYIQAVQTAGFKPIALEFHPLSAARALPKSHAPVVLSIESKTSTTFAAVAAQSVRHMRSVSGAAETLENERRNFSRYVELEENLAFQNVTLDDIPLLSEFASARKIVSKHHWLIAGGAALRGQLPRSADTIVSLMPLGTEAAYALERRQAFVAFIRNTAVAVSVFFAAAFFAVWMFMLTLEDRANAGFATLATVPNGPLIASAESTIQETNDLLAAANSIIGTSRSFGPLLKDMLSSVPPGITISAASLSSRTDTIELRGIADSRAILRQFKLQLEAWDQSETVTLPLTNLEQKERIPFSMTIILKKPGHDQ